MKTLFAFFLLFISSAAFAQNIYSLDSTDGVLVPDTVTYAGVKFAGTPIQVLESHYHRGNSHLTVAFRGAPANAFSQYVSIPTVANGTYVATLDSVSDGTLNLIGSAGDTIATGAFYAYLHVGATHPIISFLNGSAASPFDNYLRSGMTMVFIKQ